MATRGLDLMALIDATRSRKAPEERTLTQLLRLAEEVLFQEGTLLNLRTPITICGDVHGQFYDVIRLFQEGGQPPDVAYLFLGDYVDRGRFSLETVVLLLAYKCQYPDRFHMLRGNHEARSVNTLYGFYEEIVQHYGHAGPWKLFNQVFDLLPVGALIDNRIYCVHGGLSPTIPLVDQVALMDRRMELPAQGPLCDVCWSDPEEIQCWGVNQRGAGVLFGVRPTVEFCRNNQLRMIVRAHQLAMEGYMWHFKGKQLVTVWSAPNYCYRSGNLASMLVLDGPTAEPSFKVFKAVPDSEREVPAEPQMSYFA